MDNTEHQKYTIGDNKVFSIVEEEDYRERNPVSFAKSRPGLYPSEASVKYIETTYGNKVILGHCLRAIWYRVMKIPQPDGVNTSLMMKAHLGKWAEIGIIDRWKGMGIWVANNVKFFNKQFGLSGELDAIIKDTLNDKHIGVELKSFYSYAAGRGICGVQREKGTGRCFPGKPKIDHFLQAVLYSHEYKDQLDEYRLYYIERGDGHRLEFRVGTLDDGTCYWEQIPGKYWNVYQEGKVIQPYTVFDIHNRYKEVIEYINKKSLPPKDFSSEYDADTIERMWANSEISKTDYEKWQKNPAKNPISSWQCSYCAWKKQCEQDSLTQ